MILLLRSFHDCYESIKDKQNFNFYTNKAKVSSPSAGQQRERERDWKKYIKMRERQTTQVLCVS